MPPGRPSWKRRLRTKQGQRGQKLEDLDEKATALGKASKAFHKGARTAKRFQLWQQAKFGVVVGTAVTVGVAAIVAPVVVAAL